jgi:glutamine synthetase adenylyltransferase
MFFRQRKLKAGIAEGLQQIGADDLDQAMDFFAALIAHFKFRVAQLEGRAPVDETKLAELWVAILKQAPNATLDELVPAFGEVMKQRYAPS